MSKTPRKQASTPPPPAPARGSRAPLAGVALAIGVAAIALFAYSQSGPRQPGGSPVADQAGQPSPSMTPPPATSVAESAPPPQNAKFGPHRQTTLPPLPWGPSPPARPPDVVRSVYKFSAEHPEVLGYVPCYCGCERSGHRGNDDCFVASRAANGDVTDWEPHGMT